MLLAYVDESGNTGSASARGSLTFSLGCVLVDADHWAAAFDELIAFRRRLRETYKLPMRSEVKANYLIRNSGPLRSLRLGPEERRLIYRAHLRVLDDLPARAFAVVIDKRDKLGLAPTDIFDMAWARLLERLERTSTKEKSPLMITHDEGEEDRVRRWARKARRHMTAGSAFGTGPLSVPARNLVDDPVSRQSNQSYFIQLADLVAYSAFRSVVTPGPSIAPICDQAMWLEIGHATHAAVSGFRPHAAPGIVLR